MLAFQPSEEDSSEIEQIFKTQEAQDEEEEREENGEGLEDN